MPSRRPLSPPSVRSRPSRTARADRALGSFAPAFYAALGAAAVSFLMLTPSLRFQLALALVVTASAAASVLIGSSSPSITRIALRLLCLATGLLIGSVLLIERERDRAYSGLPVARVCAYRVRLTADAVRGRFSQTRLEGRLVSVTGVDGTTASAAGRVLVIGAAPLFRWGRLLCVRGELTRSDAGQAGWFGRAQSVQAVTEEEPWLISARSHVRSWLEGRLSRLRAEDAALLRALLIGVREELSDAELFFFRKAGVIHLLALSGFHLGILSVIVVALLAPLLGRARAMSAALMLIGAYLVAVGPRVSLLRAALMFALLWACRRTGRVARGLDLLGGTFLINILVWPASLTTLSFQLSYLALAGIMVIGPVCDRALTRWLPKLVRLPVAASIGALLATAPLLAARFGLFYPIGLLSTLLLTPLVTAYMWIGLGLLLLPLPAATLIYCGLPLTLVHRALVALAEFCARVQPVRCSDWGSLLWGLILATLLLSAGGWIRRWKRR